MEMNFLEALIEWQQAGRRSLDIEINNHNVSEAKITIWVYDYDFMSGTHVHSIEELQSLDLLGLKRKRLSIELATLELEEKAYAHKDI